MNIEKAQKTIRSMHLDHVLDGDTVIFHGESMQPFIQNGDQLTIAQADWEAIEPGDIVAYVLEDKYPTLRVVRKQGDRLWLIGDNWPRRKFAAWREHILGKVTSRKRHGQVLLSSDLQWRLTSQYRLMRYRAGLANSRLRHLPQLLENRGARNRRERYSWPPQIQVNISSTCNLKCRMCPYIAVHEDPQRLDFMTRETFERILPLVQEIREIHLSGSGEPMFNEDLFEFVTRVREVAPGTAIAVSTNGTLLTESRSRKLIEHRVDKLIVSFDGMPGRIETIRIGVDGEKVMANISRLTQLKREMGTDYPKVKINYMSGYGAYWDLNAFIELAHENGVSEIQMLEIQPGRATDVVDNLYNEMGQDDGAALKNAVMLAAYYGIKLHIPTTVRDACYHSFNTHFGEDGEVSPCSYLDYDGRRWYSNGEELQLPATSYGNINQKSFAEIWQNPDYVALRERNSRGDFDAACRACYGARLPTAERIEDLLGIT